MTNPTALTLLVCALLAPGCGASPAASSVLRLNEVVPSNTAGCADEAGEKDDWVELYNGSDQDLDLAGYSITDDANVPLKHRFGEGLVVKAHGVLVLWADGTPTQGVTHLPFKLNADKEQVLLFDPDETFLDEVEWTKAATDRSWARFPDGTGEFAGCGTPTCGASNGAACGE